MTRAEIIDAIVRLDLEEADWRRRVDGLNTEASSLQAWGALITQRRQELRDLLRRAGRAEEIRKGRKI